MKQTQGKGAKILTLKASDISKSSYANKRR